MPDPSDRISCDGSVAALAFADRCTWLSSAFTVVDSSMKLRMNVLPGLTTDTAWFRRPIRELRSHFVPER